MAGGTYEGLHAHTDLKNTSARASAFTSRRETEKHAASHNGQCACFAGVLGVCLELASREAGDEVTTAANNYRSVVWRS